LRYINHPNIIHMYEIFEAKNFIILVLELIEG